MAGQVHIEAIVARGPLPPAVSVALTLSMIEAYAEQDLRAAQLRGLRVTIAADRVGWVAAESGPDTDTAERVLGRLLFRALTGRPWTDEARVTGLGVQGAGGEDAVKLLERLFAHPPDLSGARRLAMEARRRNPLYLGAWLKAQFPSLAPAAADLEAWTGVYPTGRLAELLQQRGGLPKAPVDPPAALDALMFQVKGEATPVQASTPLIVAERLTRPAATVTTTRLVWIVALTAVLTAIAVGLTTVLLGGRS